MDKEIRYAIDSIWMALLLMVGAGASVALVGIMAVVGVEDGLEHLESDPGCGACHHGGALP